METQYMNLATSAVHASAEGQKAPMRVAENLHCWKGEVWIQWRIEAMATDVFDKEK